MHATFDNILCNIKYFDIVKRHAKIIFTIGLEIKNKEMLYFYRVNKCNFLSNAGHDAS